MRRRMDGIYEIAPATGDVLAGARGGGRVYRAYTAEALPDCGIQERKGENACGQTD